MPHLTPAARVRSLMTLVVGLAAALLTLGAAPGHAADNGAWSVSPTPPKGGSTTPRNYFILEGDPGTTIKEKVRIQNWTEKPITFNLYGADGYNTAADGFFALRDLNTKMTDLGRWITPLISQVTVHGLTQTDIPVTIKIPRNATPGDHVGGVVAVNTKIEATKKDDSGLNVGIQRAIGARMYVRVSGTTSPGLEVSDVAFAHDRGSLPWTGEGRGTVTYTLKNTGNLRLEPEGAVTLNGLFGEITRVEKAAFVDLLPGQQVRMTQKVTDVPFIGRVTAQVQLEAGEDLDATADTTVWLLPWPFIVAGLLLLVAVGWLLKRRAGLMRRKLRAAESAPKITVTAGA